MIKNIALFLILFFIPFNKNNGSVPKWGFFGHKLINKLAVFTLPPPLSVFYKDNIKYITEKAVNPDKRRYIAENEGQKHYIDLDSYPDSLTKNEPANWRAMEEHFDHEFLKENGTLPWNLIFLKYRLTEAFKQKDSELILRLSADAGHYLGDANVPLHTTSNYNGQLTGQHGIHGFWESRLPEQFSDSYDLITGKATYIFDFKKRIWEAVKNANMGVDSVLLFEKILSDEYSSDKKYSYEKRGKSVVRTYSRKFSTDYHDRLNGMVERQMRRSIKIIGDFWYSCWVDAGMPELSKKNNDITGDTLTLRERLFPGRGH